MQHKNVKWRREVIMCSKKKHVLFEFFWNLLNFKQESMFGTFSGKFVGWFPYSSAQSVYIYSLAYLVHFFKD